MKKLIILSLFCFFIVTIFACGPFEFAEAERFVEPVIYKGGEKALGMFMAFSACSVIIMEIREKRNLYPF